MIHLMLSSFLPLPVKNPGEELIRCIRSSIQLLESFTEDDKHRYEYNDLIKLACAGPRKYVFYSASHEMLTS